MDCSPSPEDLPTSIAAPRFPLFKKLPFEVRQMIWKYSIFPRVVYLQLDGILKLRNISYLERHQQPHFGKYNGDWNPKTTYVYKSPTIVPMYLTCRESREIAKKHYSQISCSGNKLYNAPPVLFDFDIDTLYLHADRHPCGSIGMGKLGKRIRNLAVALEDHRCERWTQLLPGNQEPPSHRVVGSLINYYENVETLTIVHQDHRRWDGDLVELDGVYALDGSMRTFLSRERDFPPEMEAFRKEEQDWYAGRFERDVMSKRTLEKSSHEAYWRNWPLQDLKIPSVSCRTITTRKKWEECCETRAIYEKRLALYECMLSNP
ncbi:hypothetical protein BJ875DRAFT_438615 [Amylocarpus encephaloides]|uniref:2EXR domain-containing protein n=1 Tax=Amylocarpus encephaloides TaxID=45428 RepID=A0A9P7YPD8_9HELO|nr:hypothetical protein BJ875DRAFT_438615 [Amylocarpus encephaloides]